MVAGPRIHNGLDELSGERDPRLVTMQLSIRQRSPYFTSLQLHWITTEHRAETSTNDILKPLNTLKDIRRERLLDSNFVLRAPPAPVSDQTQIERTALAGNMVYS